MGCGVSQQACTYHLHSLNFIRWQSQVCDQGFWYLSSMKMSSFIACMFTHSLVQMEKYKLCFHLGWAWCLLLEVFSALMIATVNGQVSSRSPVRDRSQSNLTICSPFLENCFLSQDSQPQPQAQLWKSDLPLKANTWPCWLRAREPFIQWKIS